MSLGINTRITNTTEQPSAFSRGETLYVGGSGDGNYTEIQDAIDNASDGDTIFVYDDSSPYYEHILINKEINVVGENKETTIIDAQEQDNVVRIISNHSSLKYFTLQNSSTEFPGGVHIGPRYSEKRYQDITIENNIIINCGYGIDCGNGYLNNCEISFNTIYHGSAGIIIFVSSDVYIHDNIIQHAGSSLDISTSRDCIISNNVFSEATNGVYLEGSTNIKFIENTFSNNYWGAFLQDAYFNKFKKNNFIDNNISAFFLSHMFLCPVYNKWVSNYWDDLGSKIIKRIQGIWWLWLPFSPIAIEIPRFNYDWFPAKEPYDI
jgi:parallel beta-helix repeat protein